VGAIQMTRGIDSWVRGAGTIVRIAVAVRVVNVSASCIPTEVGRAEHISLVDVLSDRYVRCDVGISRHGSIVV
jgi:hypothetical protein